VPASYFLPQAAANSTGLLNSESPSEEEIIEKLVALKFAIGRHDRGVIFGFALSLLPIFPAALFGTLVGLFNSRLVRSGKLDSYEESLVHKGLVLGTINSVISIIILYFVLRFMNEVGWHQFVQNTLDSLYQYLDKLQYFKNHSFEKSTV
jgi:hypothetical protein